MSETKISQAVASFEDSLMTFGSALHRAVRDGRSIDAIVHYFGELMAAWGEARWRILLADASAQSLLAAAKNVTGGERRRTGAETTE